MTTAADIALSYLAAFAAGDPVAIASHVSDDFVNEHLSELGSGCTGREEYLSRLPGFLTTFADRSYSVDDVVETSKSVDVGTVVVRYKFQATTEGTQVTIPGIMWFTIADGHITRRTDLWDSLTFLRQTGQAPSA